MQVSDKHTAGNSAISNNINSHLCICQSDIKEIVNLPASDDYDFVDIKFANIVNYE
ncbi:MAG: hypothetical protein NTV87_09195 [Ignavibacteriae bacterium]|nr:hypothetical protein [Ignavibacteriota bacterium]